MFAHGIHLSERECRCLAHKNAALAHCPSSNLFIGSGLFDLGRAQQYGIRVGIGSDVGGGTSLSLLANLADAYKIQQLRGTSLDPFQALYLATLGGARALDLDGLVGNFLLGREADFVALDLAATPMIAQRMEHARGLADTLFVLNTLGDDRAVAETWVMGSGAMRRVRASSRVGSARRCMPPPRAVEKDAVRRAAEARVTHPRPHDTATASRNRSSTRFGRRPCGSRWSARWRSGNAPAAGAAASRRRPSRQRSATAGSR